MPRLFDCIAATGPLAYGETTCPIDLEEITPDTETLTHTLCRNTFCRECLETWIKQQPCGALATCPIDRQIIGVGENVELEDEDEEEIGEDVPLLPAGGVYGDEEHEVWNPRFTMPEQSEDQVDEDVAAMEAEDRMWDARIMADFDRIMDTMTNDFGGVLRRPGRRGVALG